MQLAFSITTTTRYVAFTMHNLVRSRNLWQIVCMVRYIVGFGITTTTRCIASTINQLYSKMHLAKILCLEYANFGNNKKFHLINFAVYHTNHE